MIKAAELLFKAPEADKPTVLVLIDRNELEDQMLRNLASLGLGQHPARPQHRGAEQAAEGRLPRDRRLDDPQVSGHAGEPQHAAEHLRADRRGPPHDRRRPGQLPHGRPPERRVHRLHRHAGGQDRLRQGTFKTFGTADDKGYLHKYSITESIEDGTTLPLYYNLAPNEMLVRTS